MKVYVSGRIKDYPEYLDHFDRECKKINALGHDAVNPCTIEHIPNPTYTDFMRADLKALLDCDAIYMLDGWENSVGARCEHLVAAMSGFEMFYESHRNIEYAKFHRAQDEGKRSNK